MSNNYLGEIRMFGGNFAPVGWALCQGQLLAISENEALFNLIGTTYGGDGQSTFALPDLRGRLPVEVGTGFALAQSGGAETVTLTSSQMPTHSHFPHASTNPGDAGSPNGAVWATTSGPAAYATTGALAQMDAAAVGAAGGSQPHDNMPPFLCVNFIIALEGLFPSQT